MTQDVATQLTNYLSTFLPLILLVAAFYFLLIRPQKKKDKAKREMLNNLKNGDRVTTIGGFFGTVSGIKDDVITITVGPDQTKLMVARWAISTVDGGQVAENEGEKVGEQG